MTNKALGVAGGLTGIGCLGGGVTYLVLNNSSQIPKDTETKVPEPNTVVKPTPASAGKKISEWLSGNGKSILADGAPEWGAKWTSFKENYSADKEREEPWKLSDWVAVFSQSDAPKSFKDKCKANADTVVDSVSNSLYTEIEKYCTN